MATPQPDFHVLSDSLIAAGQKISLIPNLPAIDHERYMRDQFTALQQEMNEQFSRLRVELDTRFEQVNTQFNTRFDQVDKRFEQVDTQFEQINTRFANLELSTKAE